MDGRAWQRGALALALMAVAGCGGAESTLSVRDGPRRSGCDSACGGVCSRDGPHLVTLASELSSPGSIAVDAANVYYSTGYREARSTAERGVSKVSIGGGAPVALASQRDDPESIRVDGSWVYWTDYGESPGAGAVLRVPVGGGSSTTLFVGENPSELAIGGGNVFFLADGGTAGLVVKVPVAGGNAATVAELPSVSELAVDADAVYWAEYASVSRTQATIRKLPLDGSPAVTLAVEQPSVFDLVVDETGVYWTTDPYGAGDNAGAVMKVSRDGGAPVVLADGQRHPSALAVDGTCVYWVEEGTPTGEGYAPDGTVRSVPIEGGTPFTLASDQSMPTALAVDGTSVYWTTYGATGLDGTVNTLTPK
jgi:hypothetical protein